MFAALSLSFLLWPVDGPSIASVPSHALADDPALASKIAAAGNNIAKLLELAAACSKNAAEEDAKKVYRRILELDSSNEAAHKGLNHQLYDKQWFEGFAELAKYKREEDARMKQKGLARFKEEWVPESDVPFLNMQWSKDDKGVWQIGRASCRERVYVLV